VSLPEPPTALKLRYVSWTCAQSDAAGGRGGRALAVLACGRSADAHAGDQAQVPRKPRARACSSLRSSSSPPPSTSWRRPPRGGKLRSQCACIRLIYALCATGAAACLVLVACYYVATEKKRKKRNQVCACIEIMSGEQGLLARDDTRWRIIMCFRTLFSHYFIRSTPSMLYT
jgi:hypothetical protein